MTVIFIIVPFIVFHKTRIKRLTITLIKTYVKFETVDSCVPSRGIELIQRLYYRSLGIYSHNLLNHI